MITQQQVEAFFRQGHRQCIPHVSVDCVIFGFHGRELKVLILKWKHIQQWSLPGGPVRRTQSLDEAARAVLYDRTGLSQVFLQQFHAFGSMHRGEGVLRRVFKKLGVNSGEATWLADRTISIGYYALVDYSRVNPQPDFFSDQCSWCDVAACPPLMFDHQDIVQRAHWTLQRQLYYQPIGLNLLPKKFTMPELQGLYEAVLGRTLDRRNFQKRILQLGIVRKLDERRRGGAYRAPYLYCFDKRQYQRALQDGLLFGA